MTNNIAALLIAGTVLLAVITIINFGTLLVNLKLYTEIMKEKSQRGRAGPQ